MNTAEMKGDYEGQMVFGTYSLPTFVLQWGKIPEKNLTQETCHDRESNFMKSANVTSRPYTLYKFKNSFL